MMNSEKYKQLPIIILIAHLCIGLIYSLYISWYTNTLGGDTLEHIHASWLIYANYIPYKDFFQHHNPLLWYIFSPIVGLHAHGVDDNIITSIVVSIAIIVSFIGYYYLYKITSEFISNKRSGIVASAITLTPYILVANLNFRPDNFMITTFFSGLYYYFLYVRDQNKKSLIISMILFWCSFMFLQKIIFTLVILAIITFYFLYKGKIILKDMMDALIIPLILTIIFLCYLGYHNILAIWYHSNFTVNLYIPELFAERRIGTFWLELKILILGGFLALIMCLRKSNVYFKILSIIFVAELIQRYFYFSAFAYYFYLLIHVSAILTAVFIEEKIFSKKPEIIYLLCVALIFCMYKPQVYEGNIGDKITRFYTPLNKKILASITPCDYVLNGDESIYNLYNRDPYYYWNLLGQIDVIGAKAGIHPLMNINQVIETYKPKIIYGKPYYDKYDKERGVKTIVHKVNKRLLDKYYKKYENSEDLYILKPEYSHIKCSYDYKKRYYEAYD